MELRVLTLVGSQAVAGYSVPAAILLFAAATTIVFCLWVQNFQGFKVPSIKAL